jgi:hypothetical protein
MSDFDLLKLAIGIIVALYSGIKLLAADETLRGILWIAKQRENE